MTDSARSEAAARPADRLGPILVVVGPTAAGKTTLGIELARQVGGEVVNADALQVYRGLDLGTAKPTAEERAAVPHHLVDILEPTETYSAGDFARHARAAIRDIEGRGKIAVVVGGSGLYVKALVEGLSPMPRRDPEIRAALKRRIEQEGVEALHLELSRSDPETAARVEPRDRQRIVRALEVAALAGRPMSALWAEKPADFVPVREVLVGLTVPRSILYDRIADRVHAMVEAGWVEEVKVLLERGISPSAPAFQAIGYRQLVQHILGTTSLDQAVQDTIIATRRYAKRQLTWFRNVEDVRWLPALELDSRLPTLLHELNFEGAFAR